MKIKDMFFNEIYWIGFGMFVGIPFVAHFMLGGGFQADQFLLATFVYTALFFFWIRATSRY